MAKASINIKPCKGGSEAHNTRAIKPDYILKGREDKHWGGCYEGYDKPLTEIRTELEKNYIKHHPQRKAFDSRTEPIREAVINLDPNAFINEKGKIDVDMMFNRLYELNGVLLKKYKITPLQMHIHGDEGHVDKDSGKIKINWHAHVVYAWQDLDTGKSIKLNKKDMSDIQTLTADILGMQRGVVGSKAERLEHNEYRTKMKELDSNIEQKKNVLVGLENEIIGIKTEISKFEQLIDEIKEVAENKPKIKFKI